MVEDPGQVSFLIAGATGSCVGSTAMREKAADVIHATSKSVICHSCIYLSSFHPFVVYAQISLLLYLQISVGGKI